MVTPILFQADPNPRPVPADLWLRFYRLEVDSADTIYAFCSEFAFIPRRPSGAPLSLPRDLVATVRGWHRVFAPLTETILRHATLDSGAIAEWNGLAHFHPRFREVEIAAADGPPSRWVQEVLVTRDPLAPIARQLLREYALRLQRRAEGMNAEDYAPCPVCGRLFYIYERRGQRSQGCTRDCSYELKKRRQRAQRTAGGRQPRSR